MKTWWLEKDDERSLDKIINYVKHYDTVHVGCDSKYYSKGTKFAIAIGVYQNPCVTYWYSKSIDRSMKRDIKMRLMSEVEKAIEVAWKIREKLPNISGERKFSPMDRSLRRELKSTFGHDSYWFSTSKFKNAVEIKIKSESEIIEFLVPKEMVSASSVRLFVLWTTLPSVLLIIIALIFLKNQTRPLVKLAKAAERFGKGDYVNDFRASGAQEIRKAAYEFDRMVKRINRHLNQRSEMLSGISHDLRTPLTRLKLQLAMLNQKEISDRMSKDIDEMERMLDDYLQFAKTQTQESTSTIDLNIFFQDLLKEFKYKNLHIMTEENYKFVGRKNALKRCFNNLIQNGLSYGKNVYVSLNRAPNRLSILVEDDGPGIPKDQHRNVFKPFYRLDKSRSLNKSGVGLGLSISEDIINSHGGSIQLSKSKYSGLLVKVFLPI